ncbi:MAG: hypothetical protein C1943_05475 [Halochromatium sp.]|nr:hypothetical protein [Halochromatium sp.]
MRIAKIAALTLSQGLGLIEGAMRGSWTGLCSKIMAGFGHFLQRLPSLYFLQHLPFFFGMIGAFGPA